MSALFFALRQQETGNAANGKQVTQCKWCGAELKGKLSRQKYCDNKCACAYHNMLKREKAYKRLDYGAHGFDGWVSKCLTGREVHA